MDRNIIIGKAEAHVREIYESHPSEVFTYHNLGHVEQVVKKPPGKLRLITS